MPRSGLGTYRRAYRDAVNGPASLEAHNGELQDIADEFNNSLDKAGTTPMTGPLDFNAQELILDADGDTSITADTDDRIDFKIGGSDRLAMTAGKAAALNSASAAGTTGSLLYTTASNVYANTTVTTIGRALLAAVNAGGVFDVLETGGFGEVLIETKNASASSAIDFALAGTYSEYVIRVRRLIASNAVALFMRTSTDGGSTFDAGASDYAWNASGASDAADSEIQLGFSANGLPTSAVGFSFGWNADIHIIRPADAAYCVVWGFGCQTDGTFGAETAGVCAGIRLAAANVDAVRLLPELGTLTSGQFSLYGIS